MRVLEAGVAVLVLRGCRDMAKRCVRGSGDGRRKERGQAEVKTKGVAASNMQRDISSDRGRGGRKKVKLVAGQGEWRGIGR